MFSAQLPSSRQSNEQVLAASLHLPPAISHAAQMLFVLLPPSPPVPEVDVEDVVGAPPWDEPPPPVEALVRPPPPAATDVEEVLVPPVPALVPPPLPSSPKGPAESKHAGVAVARNAAHRTHDVAAGPDHIPACYTANLVMPTTADLLLGPTLARADRTKLLVHEAQHIVAVFFHIDLVVKHGLDRSVRPDDERVPPRQTNERPKHTVRP